MTVFDKAEWHPDGSFEAIGRFLDWAIHRDLVDPALFEPEHLEAIREGEMKGADLVDYVDGVLASDMLAEECIAFVRACYPAYLEELSRASPGSDVAASLDRLLMRWRAGDVPDTPEGWPPSPPSPSGEDLVAMIASEHSYFIGPETMPPEHQVPEAESVLPADLVKPPLRVESFTATSWGEGMLNRALERFGMSRDDAVVITGMGGPNGVAAITIYVVPGVPAAALRQEFRKVVFKGGGRWVERPFGGRDVVMAEGHAPGFEVLFWAIEGHVVHLAGDLPVLEPLVARLPFGLA